jgi:hypothetical protein
MLFHSGTRNLGLHHQRHAEKRVAAPLSDTATGDETYIRVVGKHQYTFFFLESWQDF